MLELEIPARELFDESTNEFIYITEGTKLRLEHSLLSISKWEARWKKPFLDDKPKNKAEIIDYIRCMTVSQNVNPSVYYAIDNKCIDKVEKYISDPMTATWFSEKENKKTGRKTGKDKKITSELIYYWMIASNIPVEFEKWHLNRLMTLIRICSIENGAKDQMSKRDVMAQNRSLNAARRAKHKTKG